MRAKDTPAKRPFLRRLAALLHIGHGMNRRRLAGSLFALTYLSYALFNNCVGNPNSTTRLAMSLAVVERGELTIDALADNTFDKAKVGEHFYSDKAPGMSLMAIPIVYVVVSAMDLLGSPPTWYVGTRTTIRFTVLHYLAAHLTSALLVALAVVALYETALWIGAAPGGAAFAALAFGLGTPAWGWATAFFEHGAAAAVLFLALGAVLFVIREEAERPGSWRAVLLAMAAGSLLGWSIEVEYIAAPAAALIALYGLSRLLRSFPAGRAIGLAAAAAAGGLLAVLPLLLVNAAAFGSPFAVGYDRSARFEGMSHGFFGIGLPDLRVALALLFGEYRGLLWISPILLAVPIGVFRLARKYRHLDLAVLIVAIGAYYVLLNSGYYYWDGGRSTGPRHVTAMLPFICLPLSLAWSDAKPATRVILVIILGVSICLSLMCASVGMDAEMVPRLLQDYVWPNFTGGNWRSMLLSRVIPPPYTLLPLIVLWGATAFRWRQWITLSPVNDVECRGGG